MEHFKMCIVIYDWRAFEFLKSQLPLEILNEEESIEYFGNFLIYVHTADTSIQNIDPEHQFIL